MRYNTSIYFVLTQNEVRQVLNQMKGIHLLMANVVYGDCLSISNNYQSLFMGLTLVLQVAQQEVPVKN